MNAKKVVKVIDEVLEKLTHGNIKLALELLPDAVRFNNEFLEESIQLTRRHNELRRQIRMGLLLDEDATIKANRITHAIMEILDELEISELFIEDNKKNKSKFLDIGNSGLNRISESIGDCIWLESISLGNGWYEQKNDEWLFIKSNNQSRRNKIRKLPNSLSKLINLKHLWIIGDQNFHFSLEELLPLAELKNLETLYIDYTNIKDLSPIKKLNKLVNFSCIKTEIENLEPLT